MPSARMNRDEFFTKLTPLDDNALRKVLWKAAQAPPDPDLVLMEVTEFTDLARSGAYIAGDRRVSPKERTRWRITFRQLAADAQAALRADDPAPAEQALALIIDLACDMNDRQYFRSEDPVQAAVRCL